MGSQASSIETWLSGEIVCVSDAQGCDEMQNVVVRSIAPSHGMKAERQKMVQACNFETTDATLSLQN